MKIYNSKGKLWKITKSQTPSSIKNSFFFFWVFTMMEEHSMCIEFTSYSILSLRGKLHTYFFSCLSIRNKVKSFVEESRRRCIKLTNWDFKNAAHILEYFEEISMTHVINSINSLFQSFIDCSNNPIDESEIFCVQTNIKKCDFYWEKETLKYRARNN